GSTCKETEPSAPVPATIEVRASEKIRRECRLSQNRIAASRRSIALLFGERDVSGWIRQCLSPVTSLSARRPIELAGQGELCHLGRISCRGPTPTVAFVGRRRFGAGFFHRDTTDRAENVAGVVADG